MEPNRIHVARDLLSNDSGERESDMISGRNAFSSTRESANNTVTPQQTENVNNLLIEMEAQKAQIKMQNRLKEKSKLNKITNRLGLGNFIPASI